MKLLRLRRLRQRKALTRAELAALAGVHRNTVSRLEAGTTTARMPTARKLAAALGAAPADLMDDTDDGRKEGRP